MINKSMHKSKAPLTAPVLGQREIDTLRLFWRSEATTLSATDIHKILKEQAETPQDVISINTIQSTIERLWKKNLLSRNKQGKAFIYKAAYSKQEVISSLISEISDALGEGDDSAIMSGIFTFLKSKNTRGHRDLLQALGNQPSLIHASNSNDD
ncbi:BlaI/MecI/CopY family transcriptional regulator [Paraglaciecola arctica]|uniref:BlaI/MecI/CopY family transcriptional regulator n=1 Tax=Paraglaciecola arctica TaxID=1128911 RepID=UPI001C06EA1D|nr:BlaI/MecI/CopY family transcriptional regulator [Paraglaciecola arctica]MBU3006166.1 BlaI/MecI/CopY family transcriptional regulator [Paraglaciecola arctica]